MIGLSIFVFVTFLMLFLGGTVFVHDPRSRVNRLFLVWGVLAVLWMINSYLENVQAFSPQVREFFLRADFASAMVAAGFILLFALNFIDNKISLSRLALYLMPALVLGGLSFSPWLFSEVFFDSTGEIRFREGVVFFFYAPAVLVYFILSSVLLLRERRHVGPAQRAQMTSVASGIIAMATVSSVINLYFQNVLPADVFRIGIYSVLFFIMGVAWAIARHEFLQIRFVVVEVLFLGILATLLTRTILSRDLEDLVINVASFSILLVLAFFMIRSFLNEERQRRELEKLAAELALKNEKLREMDKLKSDFISIASHQLRTPISVIKGYLTLILDGAYGKVEGPMQVKVTAMVDMAERLVTMINEMLNVSRIERNKIDYICTTFDVAEVTRSIVTEMQAKASEKKLTLSFIAHDTEGSATAQADKDKIKEVLSNLIDNAIKYSISGTVEVSVRARPALRDTVVTVSDEGYGIAPEDAVHMFEKFYRSNMPEIARLTGTGLGLYVCRMFLRDMGGDVWIESTALGKGTVFAFSVPRDKSGRCDPKNEIHPQAP